MKMRQKNTSQRVQKNSLSQKSEQDLWREEAEMMHLFRQNRGKQFTDTDLLVQRSLS